MKSILAISVIAGLVLFLGGCGYTAPIMPPTAGVYTSVYAPADHDMDRTTLGSKQGSARTTSILGIVAVGDASVSAAAKNGGLKTVNHIDYKYFNVLGVYQSFEIIAHGE